MKNFIAFICFILASLHNIAFAELPPKNFGTINDWYCFKNSPATCYAVGYKQLDDTQSFLLLKSVDGGDHWDEQATPTSGLNGKFISIDCSFKNSICIILGEQIINNKVAPLLLQNNQGKDWVLKQLPNGYSDVHMNFAKCAEIATGPTSGTVPFCLIAGTYDSGQHPLIIQTQDIGRAWQIYEVTEQNTASKVIDGDLDSLSCAGSSGHSSCQLYGHKNTSQGRINYLVTTNDGGNNWTYKVLKVIFLQ